MTNRVFKNKVKKALEECNWPKSSCCHAEVTVLEPVPGKFRYWCNFCEEECYPQWTATTGIQKSDLGLDKLSLCESCNCMTKNICGKCKGVKNESSKER